MAKCEGLSRLIDIGWVTARDASFQRTGTIRLWIQLQLALGVGFFQDPQFIWLSNWIKQNDSLEEEERAMLLYFHAQRYLDFIRGAENELGVAALERTLEAISELDEFEKRARPEMALEWVTHIHPKNVNFLATPS